METITLDWGTAIEDEETENQAAHEEAALFQKWEESNHNLALFLKGI